MAEQARLRREASGGGLRVGATDLGLSASLMTMVGRPSPVVAGLSSRWYFEGLERLGYLLGSDRAALEENADVVKEGSEGRES